LSGGRVLVYLAIKERIACLNAVTEYAVVAISVVSCVHYNVIHLVTAIIRARDPVVRIDRCPRLAAVHRIAYFSAVAKLTVIA
jgi:hypothetical protein